MRTLELRLGIAVAALAPLSAAFAQQATVAPVDLPKVIFCSGQCFAVDEKGVRTQVTKGAVLREGLRLETGPGAYAQLKIGQAAELAVSERGRVSFDQKTVGGRDLVILDQGRIRMIGGEAMGKLERRALELRTPDGTFALKGADVEVKKLASAAGSNLTYLKVNNGDASLRAGQLQVALSKDSVQGIAGGKLITDRRFSLNEVALPPTPGTKPSIGPGTTLTITPAPVASLPPISITTGGAITAIGTSMPPVMTTMQATTATCLSCTTAIAPTTYSISPTTTTTLSTATTAPTTSTLNTTLAVVLAPTTTFTATTSPTTTTTTSTLSTSTLSTSTLSTSTLSTSTTCLSCTSLITTSPTTTTTTSTTSSTGTLSTTKLTSTTLTLSSTSLLLK